MKNNKYQIKDISDEEIYEAIKKSKEHYDKYQIKSYPFISVKPTFPPDYLKYPEKLVLAKMDKMCDEDKLEYGVSLRTAWIVEK